MTRRGIVKSSELGSFKKTERVLYLMPFWEHAESEDVKKMVAKVEDALETIRDDVYYDIIGLKYFRRWTHEKIAEHFDVDVSVISKQRTRLVSRIAPLIFEDEYLEELKKL